MIRSTRTPASDPVKMPAALVARAGSTPAGKPTSMPQKPRAGTKLMSGAPVVPDYEDEDHVKLPRDDKVVPLRPVRLPFINMQTWDNSPVPEQDWIVRD